jgi:acyl-CoA thioester hydrolase
MSPSRSNDLFSHPIRVRFADTDLQGHAFFGSYFTYMDEAFMAYLRELGFPFPGLEAMGLDIYYVESSCRFLGSCRFEDDLRVRIEISRLGNSSLTAEMTIVRPADGSTVAAGRITGVVVDRTTKGPTRIPDAIRDAVARYQGG